MNLFDERAYEEWLDSCGWCGAPVEMTKQRAALLGKVCDECSVFAGLDSMADPNDDYDID